MFRQALIIGVGLLGGSLAAALKKHKIAKKVVGCSRSAETIRKALKLGLIDGGSTDPKDFSMESDLVVLCSPLASYQEMAEKISHSLSASVTITDVGSVKRIVVDETLPKLSAKHRSLFVPGHPIAGTENSGPEAADADLFDGKKVILTPIEQTNKVMCQRIEEMWSKLGANVSYMTPSEHDEIYAAVSHSIQFLAYTYRLAFPGQSKNKDENFKQFFRIAKSPSGIWLDIFKANKTNISNCLKVFRENFFVLVDEADDKVLLPRIVAKSAINMVGDNRPYAGSGFRDFTSAAENNVKCEQTLAEVAAFIAMFDNLHDALKKDQLENFLPSS